MEVQKWNLCKHHLSTIPTCRVTKWHYSERRKERKTKRRKKEGKKRRMFDTLCKHSVNSGKTKKYRTWAQVLQRVYSIVT